MNKEIKLKYFLIVISILIVIEVFILGYLIPKHKNEVLKERCKTSVCNEDKTNCYSYEITANDETKVIWKGNCSKVK